jgi:hypothetical protein
MKYILLLTALLGFNAFAVQSVTLKCPQEKSTLYDEIKLYWNEDGFTAGIYEIYLDSGRPLGINEPFAVGNWADTIGQEKENSSDLGKNSPYRNLFDWITMSLNGAMTPKIVAINRKTGQYLSSEFEITGPEDGPYRLERTIEERLCTVPDDLF